MAEDLTGKTVGDYDILGVIGRGGMGVVYEARQRTIPREIAFKVPHEHLAADEDFIRRFFLEGRTAQRINHANIVNTYAVGSEGPIHYIAMERVRGRPLTAIIKRRKELTLDRMLKIAQQVAKALREIHKIGYVHRDIKPDNVFVTDTWRVKLMDFGIAVPLGGNREGVTGSDDWLGTSIYLPPEVALGGKPTPLSDLYSLGVVLFEMLTGRVPYAHREADELRRMIVDDPVPDVSRLLPDAGGAVQLIIDMTLAKDPADRYGSADELIEDIDRAIEELASKPAKK